MTEKDMQKETVEEAAEHLEQLEQSEKVEQVTDIEADETVDLADETEGNASPAEEEKSDFLKHWEERHQAYLAATQSKTDTVSEKPVASKTTSKPQKSKKQPEIDKTLVNPTEDIATIEKINRTKAIPTKAIWKTVPVFLIAMLLVILSIYFISPLGKEKMIQVKGNQNIDGKTIIKNSLISDEDYVLTTYLNRSGHARNIEHSSAWIKNAKIDFQFPNRFAIVVEEFSQIGFIKQGEEYYSVLSSGKVAETATSAEKLPATYTTIYLSDETLIKQLVHQLNTIDTGILEVIEEIRLTPNKVTNDLLTLTMRGGNTILVPLSEIDIKLPYYTKIAQQLQVASVIDMEVGIFSYAKQ